MNKKEIIKIDKPIITQQKLKLFKIINYSVGDIDLSKTEIDDLIVACNFNNHFINVVIKYCLVDLFYINYQHHQFKDVDEYYEQINRYQINDCVNQRFQNRFNIKKEKKLVEPGISSGSVSPKILPNTMPNSKNNK